MTDLPKNVEGVIKECVPDLEIDEDHARESCARRLEMWRERLGNVDGEKWAKREISTLLMRAAVVEAAMEEIDG